MANITYSLSGFAFKLPQDRLTQMREILFSRLEKTPKGLDSTIGDIYVETFRRVAAKLLPTTPFLWAAVSETHQGPLGLALMFIENGATYPGTYSATTKVSELAQFFGGYMLADTIDGNDSPLAEEHWTVEEGVSHTLAFARALQLALSGEERGTKDEGLC